MQSYLCLFWDKVMFLASLWANGRDIKGFLLNTLEMYLSFLHMLGLHSPQILT